MLSTHSPNEPAWGTRLRLAMLLAGSLFACAREDSSAAQHPRASPMTADNQSPGPSTGPAANEIGIPITRAELGRAVTAYQDRMTNDAALTTEDYATMVRLWNTIEFCRLAGEDEIYRRYRETFFPAFVERASKALNAQPTKGMALYSREHDLFLGGKPHGNSQYRCSAS